MKGIIGLVALIGMSSVAWSGIANAAARNCESRVAEYANRAKPDPNLAYAGTQRFRHDRTKYAVHFAGNSGPFGLGSSCEVAANIRVDSSCRISRIKWVQFCKSEPRELRERSDDDPFTFNCDECNEKLCLGCPG
jgi:hypothetical protein